MRFEAFRWSPDGTHIALLMPEPKSGCAAAARERQGRCARGGERGSPGAHLDVDVGSHAIKQITTLAVPHRQIEFAPGGDRLIAAASREPARRSVQRGDLLGRSEGRAIHADRRRRADRWARWRCRPTAPPSPTAARGSTVPSRTISACSRSRSAARNLTGRDRSIGRSASRDGWTTQSIASTSRAAFEPRSRRSVRDGARPTNRRYRRQHLRVRQYRRRHPRLCQRDQRRAAPELWIKPADAPARAVTVFNEPWAQPAGGRAGVRESTRAATAPKSRRPC